MSPPKAKEEKAVDPFLGLKWIAYLRSGLPINEEDADGESFLAFAKWQICKSRKVLWNDPIWDQYTPQEILIEFFTIRFDESPELRKDFESGLVTVKDKDIDWFEKMERKHATPKTAVEGGSTVGESSKINEESPQKPVEPPVEFEERFD